MIQAILIALAILFTLWFLNAFVALAGSLFWLVLIILFWMFVGYLAGKLLRGRGYGPVNDLLLGIGGGLLGSVVFSLFGLNLGGLFGTVLSGLVGAVLLVWLVRLFGNKGFAR